MYGRSDRIRTCGILLPKQARYRCATPRLKRVFALCSGYLRRVRKRSSTVCMMVFPNSVFTHWSMMNPKNQRRPIS